MLDGSEQGYRKKWVILLSANCQFVHNWHEHQEIALQPATFTINSRSNFANRNLANSLLYLFSFANSNAFLRDFFSYFPGTLSYNLYLLVVSASFGCACPFTLHWEIYGPDIAVKIHPQWPQCICINFSIKSWCIASLCVRGGTCSCTLWINSIALMFSRRHLKTYKFVHYKAFKDWASFQIKTRTALYNVDCSHLHGKNCIFSLQEQKRRRVFFCSVHRLAYSMLLSNVAPVRSFRWTWILHTNYSHPQVPNISLQKGQTNKEQLVQLVIHSSWTHWTGILTDHLTFDRVFE